MNNIAIIIQGGSTNIPEQKQVWKDYIRDCFFSTWEGNEHLYEKNDNAIFSKIPSDPGPANTNLQLTSTLAGLKRAKELGYTKALKIRSDLIPTAPETFLASLDFSKLNFLCWHNHEVYPGCYGYLVDYLMAGDIDEMIKLWSFTEIFCVVPEIMITWSYIKNCDCELKYFLPDLNETNDLFWIKYNTRLSTYKSIKSYDAYKKHDFSLTQSYLKENYLNFLQK